MHESRVLELAGGRQTVVIDGLPSTLDAEAVAIDTGRGTSRAGPARARRQGFRFAGASRRRSKHGSDRLLVAGVLLSIDGNGIGVRTADARTCAF